MRRAAAALLAALTLLATGCGDGSVIEHGGRVGGDTLTVYSVLPRTGPRAAASQQMVLGQKLAIAQAQGRAGRYAVNFVSASIPDDAGRRAVGDAVREIIRDPGISAVIGDLTFDTARVSVPLYNAAGILHVSPGAGYAGFFTEVPGDPGSPERYVPAGRPSFAPWLPTGAAEAAAIARAAEGGSLAVEAAAGEADQALAAAVRSRAGRTVPTRRADTVLVSASDPEDAFGIVEGVLRENRRARVLLPSGLWETALPGRLAGEPRVAFLTAAGPPEPAFAAAFREAFGREAGPAAQVGYDAMRSVLDAIERAGARAGVRERLIEAYFAAGPLEAAAERPFLLARHAGGRVRYEPLT